MTVKLIIAGTDRTNTIDWQSIDKNEVLTKEADSLSFLIKNYGTKTYRPALGEEVILYNNSSSFVTKPTTATRNNYTGCAGFSFTVTEEMTITQLGRLYVAGNTQNHAIKLWISTNTVTPIASGTILNASTSDSDNFKWVDITPVTLVVGSTYKIAIDDTSGGDTFKDLWVAGSDMDSRIGNVTSEYGTTSLYPTSTAGAGVYETPAMKIGYQDNIVFGGFIVETNEVVSGLAKFLEVVVKDYTQTLDRQLVSKTYENQTAKAIIDNMIATFATGFTTTNVIASTIIPKIIFNYLTISQCLQKLAEALGNYDWYVDYSKDIHFFNNTLTASPFNITDTSKNYIWGSLELHDETHQIRNEIIVRGGEIQSVTLRTEYWSGDGTRTTFPLSNKFANIPVVRVGGVTKTIGVDYIDLDASFQVMWNFTQKYIRFTAGNTPVAGTNNIDITEYPLYPLVFRKQQQASVALYGIYQYLILDKTIKDLDTASQRADAELLKYANPSKKAKFRTTVGGLVAGQTINVQSTIRSVTEDYKIQSIRTYLRTPSELEYSINLVTADNIGINDVLNKLLVKDVAERIQVDENEVVARYYSFDEEVALTDTLFAPTKTSPPYKWTSGTTTLLWNLGTWG
jgi:hypothetical protein